MRRTTALTAAAVAAAGLAMSPVLSSVGEQPTRPDVTPSDVFEPEGTYDHDCLELVPDELSPTAFTGGADINLHVRLVLDLVESRALHKIKDDPLTPVNERQAAIDAKGRQIAQDYLAEGEQSYDAIDLTLDYASFDVLHAPDLTSGERAPKMEGTQAIALAKQQYNGTRPKGTDMVYVLSDRDLTSNGSSGLAGLADCIGGIHHGSTAFATGEIDYDPEIDLFVADAYVEYTAKVAAHEVGHLMGAHHHYQACGPYAVTNYMDGYGIGGCTLMTNFVDFVSFPFSPTNQAVVRGHAEEYAVENDTVDGDGEGEGDGHGHDDGHGH